MRVIGLTGGIGAGKSTVAGFLRRCGAQIIDADVIAREMSAPGTALLGRIREEFGPQFLRENGSLDRAALARHIFADASARRRLNEIMHPPILAEVRRRVEALRKSDTPPPVVVIAAPLLYEAGAEDMVEKVMVVTAPEEKRIARLKARDGLKEDEIRRRFAAQLPPEAREARADWVIDNSGYLSDTERQIVEIYAEML